MFPCMHESTTSSHFTDNFDLNHVLLPTGIYCFCDLNTT